MTFHSSFYLWANHNECNLQIVKVILYGFFFSFSFPASIIQVWNSPDGHKLCSFTFCLYLDANHNNFSYPNGTLVQELLLENLWTTYCMAFAVLHKCITIWMHVVVMFLWNVKSFQWNYSLSNQNSFKGTCFHFASNRRFMQWIRTGSANQIVNRIRWFFLSLHRQLLIVLYGIVI